MKEKRRSTWQRASRLSPFQRVALLFLALAAGVALVGVLSRDGTISLGERAKTLIQDFYVGASTELAGIAATLLIVDAILQRRGQEREKAELRLQLGTPDAPSALDAVRRLRLRGWIEDGTLRDAPLQKASLAGAELRGAVMSGAELVEADLSGADLTGANLDGADLSEADLNGADLSKANLHAADLAGANLRRADLIRTDLSAADLRLADLRDAYLRNANLRGADLTMARLEHCDLRGADLSEATLRRMTELAAEECLVNGITSFHDAGTSFERVAFLQALAEESELDVRLWIMLSDDNQTLAERLPGFGVYRVR